MNVLDFLNTLPIFFVKYCIVSILVNIFIAFITVFILKNVSVEVKVIKNEKSQRGKNNK